MKKFQGRSVPILESAKNELRKSSNKFLTQERRSKTGWIRKPIPHQPWSSSLKRKTGLILAFEYFQDQRFDTRDRRSLFRTVFSFRIISRFLFSAAAFFWRADRCFVHFYNSDGVFHSFRDVPPAESDIRDGPKTIAPSYRQNHTQLADFHTIFVAPISRILSLADICALSSTFRRKK